MVLEHSAVLASARREDPQKSLPEQRSLSVNHGLFTECGIWELAGKLSVV